MDAHVVFLHARRCRNTRLAGINPLSESNHARKTNLRRSRLLAEAGRVRMSAVEGGSTGPHLHYEQRLNGSAIRVTFNSVGALYFGTKNYTSQNSCSSGTDMRARCAGDVSRRRSG
jgi:hypothetical protein